MRCPSKSPSENICDDLKCRIQFARDHWFFLSVYVGVLYAIFRTSTACGA